MGDVEVKIDEAQRALDKIAGKSMNANSSPQMRALFRVEKRDAPNPQGFAWYTDSGFLLPMTDAGAPSLGKDTLIIMSEQGDQRAKQVLTLRKMKKAMSFLKDHILGHVHNGRVYPNYNQTRGDNDMGTGTGRFSINDPALQQIPSRDVDIASIVRSCFLPDEGEDWCCADWEQMEFRMFAHYTKDPVILQAYQDDPSTDYHQIVSDITGIPRKPRFAGDANAKQINLGLVFGMGEGKMAYEMGLDYTVRYGSDGREWFNAGPAAQDIFSTYHTAIPGVSKLLSTASSIAKSRGFVHTIMGRHIRFPGGRATYKAGGLVFQGSSADCMKQKMVELWPICEAEGINMLLTVHDELDFGMRKSESKRQSALVKEVLETFDGERCPIELRVPIKSSVELGPNWFEASK
jgi:DNA polymerase I-like protein with 3'-5' exonuclease and polymerase domains